MSGLALETDLEALQKRVAFLEDVLRCLPDGVIVIDDEEKISVCNPLADQIRGVGMRVGRPVSECHPERSQRALQKVMTRFREAPPEEQHPIVIERANGWEVHYSRITGLDGSFRGVAWVARDISRQKKLQQQLLHQERVSGLGRMAAKLGHEVKNPLNIIAGAVHNLRSSNHHDASAREMLSIVSEQLERLQNLVDHLREVTRPLRVQLRPSSIPKILREAILALDAEADVTTSLPEELDEVRIDPDLVQRLLVNALDNAARAAGPAGHVAVIVTLDTQPAGEWVTIEVVDDGPGFPQEVLDHLFQPFVTTRPDGTGLGLVIMREICLLHGGDLAVTNEAGGGARLTARLLTR